MLGRRLYYRRRRCLLRRRGRVDPIAAIVGPYRRVPALKLRVGGRIAWVGPRRVVFAYPIEYFMHQPVAAGDLPVAV